MNSKITSRIRFALWEAYDHKCVYTQEYVKYSEIVVDHIIPQKEADQIQDRILKYNLDKDFTIDSLENLLPVKNHPNMTKGEKSFDESAEIYYLQMAKRMKPKIEKELRKLENIIKEKEQIILDIAVSEQTSQPQHPPFKVKKKITVTNVPWAPNRYWNSTENIALNGSLPSIYQEMGNCVIEFKQENIMVTLSSDDIQKIAEKHQSVKELLFRGRHPENNQSFVVIKNNALFLTDEIFLELVDILDDYLDNYNSFYNDFTSFVQAQNFIRKNDNYYILMETTRDNWRKLLQYSKKYDMDTKKSPFTFHFNYNGNTIVALDKQSNDITFELIPDHTDVYHYGEFKQPDNHLQILWRTPSTQGRIQISKHKVWTAAETYNWLITIINE